MRRHAYPLGAIVALVVLAALACNGGSRNQAGVLASGSGGVYIALGDSIAAGTGASDAATTSYVALIDAALTQRYGAGLQLQSLAVSGHTTRDLIDAQLPAALSTLRAGDVRLVTLTIGGNDLFQYSAYPPCLTDPSAADCPLSAGLTEVEEHLDRILGDLSAAAPEAAIVIEDYPDLFSGSGHPFEGQARIAFGLLDDVIERVAGRHGALIADPRETFAGRSPELTHIHDPRPDFHPNDAGHHLIADAFLKVLGLSARDAGAKDSREVFDQKNSLVSQATRFLAALGMTNRNAAYPPTVRLICAACSRSWLISFSRTLRTLYSSWPIRTSR